MFKVARKISVVCFAIALVLAFAMYIAPVEYIYPMTAAFVILTAIGLLALFALYRCPYCKGRFPMKKPLNTTVCPHCGKDLGAKI